MLPENQLQLVFNFSIDEMLQKAEVYHSLGLLNKATLVTVNTRLTTAFFTAMRTKLDVLQALPKIDERRQEGVAITALRNVDLKEGKKIMSILFNSSEQAGFPGDPFGQRKYERAAKSPLKLTAFLQAAARQAAKPEFKPELMAAGFPEEKFDRLIELAGSVQTEQTEHVIKDQTGTSVSAKNVLLYNAFWRDYIRVIRDASLTAEWANPADRDLFRLYDNVPERRAYTLQPEESKAKHLERPMTADRLLGFTVDGPGLVAALTDNPAAAPAAWVPLAPTLPRQPLKLRASELGSGQYLVVRNEASETASLAVTVIDN